MRRWLTVAGGLLLGSGLGVAVGDRAIGTPLQALLLSLLAVGTALLGAGKWAPALALSAAAASTMVGLRLAITLLQDPRLYSVLPLPLQEAAQTGVLTGTLLAISLSLTLGQLLMTEGFARLLSPLWYGLENLTTTLPPAMEARKRATALGAPLGVLAAAVDWHLRGSYWAFIVIASSLAPTSASLTFAAHSLLFPYAAKALGSAEDVALGVQTGTLLATLLAVALLYGRGGARLYRKVAVSAGTALSGLLLTILSYVVIGIPELAVYLAFTSSLLSLLSLLVAARTEGGLILPIYTPNPILPSILLLLWRLLPGQLSLPTNFLALLVSPHLHLLLAVMVLWSYRVNAESVGALVLVLSLLASTLLVVVEGLVKPGQVTARELSPWALPALGAVQLPNPSVLLAVAAATAVAVFFAYYVADPRGRVATIPRFLLDPTGLMLAYGVSASLTRTVASAPAYPLLTLLALAAGRLAAWKLGGGRLARNISVGAASAYGAALMGLTALWGG